MKELFENYSFEVFSMAKQSLGYDGHHPGGYYPVHENDLEILETKSVAMIEDGACVFEIETTNEDDLINELAKLFAECEYDKDKFEAAVEEEYTDKFI